MSLFSQHHSQIAKRLLAMFFTLGLLASCAAPDVKHYAQQTPTFDLAHYFVGKTEAWGMFQKRNGEVVKRFKVDITGTLKPADAIQKTPPQLILDEQFSYADGTHQQRIWTLHQDQNGDWIGTAADVIGEAHGQIAGNALHWQYTLLLPVDDSSYQMQFDDWMFLMDENTLVNRASMSKFGIELGQVTLFFKKIPLAK